MSRGHSKVLKSWEEMEFYEQAGWGGRGKALEVDGGPGKHRAREAIRTSQAKVEFVFNPKSIRNP